MTSDSARDAIVAVDEDAARAARLRIDRLTKPPGSLGRIEDLAVRLCAMAGGPIVGAYDRATIVIGAGDHGVAEEGVSAYPSEVTVQMVGAFCAEIAAISAFSRVARADVFVANFGVAGDVPAHPNVIDVRVARGTNNFARGDAMTEDQVEESLAAGIAAIDDVFSRAAYRVVALGEMGIGNSTSAAALVSALTGASAKAVTGRGTGIDDERLGLKRRVVRDAVERVAGAGWKRIAAAVGGYEIVGLAGAILGAAARRVPIVLDGFIVAGAALLAARIAPAALGYCIAAHRSQEPGHRIALEALGLVPLLDLDLRLGEASGAALALPLVEAATRMYAEMKTFAEAGVSEGEPS